MTVEEAIQTALAYEKRVRGVYEDAAAKAGDPVAKKMLRVLVDEEQHHVNYLEARLAEWKATGKVRAEALTTNLPSVSAIQEGVKKLKDRMQLPEAERREAIETLTRALAVEDETSAFYEKMVAQLPAGAPRALFGRFLEIEAGHHAIVQAELDSLQGNGYWFDAGEFQIERE
jgi:bacterioferritin (cytochrome b1)